MSFFSVLRAKIAIKVERWKLKVERFFVFHIFSRARVCVREDRGVVGHKKRTMNLTAHCSSSKIIIYVMLWIRRIELRELLDVLRELALEVGSLVLVDEVGLSQLVEHLLHDGILLLSLGLVGCGAELADGSAHRLAIVAIVEAALLLLTDSLER
jgi:hypothetical protein